MSSYAMWAAIRTVKSKIGTWKGYEKYNETLPGVSREEWARTIGEVRAQLANREQEAFKPLNRRPISEEITTYTSKKARGYMQQVEVHVRDRDTGIIEARPYVVKGDTLRSRISIMKEAQARYQAAIDRNPQDYPEDIVGISYVGTHHLVPGA